MNKIKRTLLVAAVAAVGLSLATGCASDPNKKTVRVLQGAGDGFKLGLVQDPVTGQYSAGIQQIDACAMVVPITIVNDGTNVTVLVPNAVLSKEYGGKGTFFGSGSSTMTCAVGDIACQSLLGGMHYPINQPYWTNSADGLSQLLPLAGTQVPTVTSATIKTLTGTNGIAQSFTNTTTTPIIIKP